MKSPAVAITNTGLVTSVGQTAQSTCVAIRAKLANPSVTHFFTPTGEAITGHAVHLGDSRRGIAKLATMAAAAIEEVLRQTPRRMWGSIPLLLCVAETERPGRLGGLDDDLLPRIETLLQTVFSPHSAVITKGHVGSAVALDRARDLLLREGAEAVLVVAADSLLMWPTLEPYVRLDRLLTERSSNGFMPGEAAGAMLVQMPSGCREVLCTGIGYGFEPASIDSDQPLRAEGLRDAVRAALAEAGQQLSDIDLRVCDVAGELYQFKEAELAIGRLLRSQRPDFELWHPSESVGEVGAAIGIICHAVANAGMLKGYAPGGATLLHLSGDGGDRAAIVCRLSEGDHG